LPLLVPQELVPVARFRKHIALLSAKLLGALETSAERRVALEPVATVRLLHGFARAARAGGGRE
jgi:hypothetical protein